MCETCAERAEIRDGTGDRGPDAGATRRVFLLLGLGLLAGCAKQATVGPMPAPPWPESPSPAPAPAAPARVQQGVTAAPSRSQGSAYMARSVWAQGEPVARRMNRMTPVRYITIHHDGMDPFFATDQAAVADHLESIRQLHRRKGWGDIGYHFAVDRAGRVWEARPMGYQGAHVKDHNPGNIGIVVLGNFEQQTPSEAQLQGVRGHVTMLMRAYHVPASRVQTHQEWGAHTACPGSTLQLHLDQLRLRGGLG